MSLVGNLEDLGLGEILQIVSLSRKSGVLQLESGDREGRVIFSDGQVIRATSTVYPENLGDLLLRGQMVDIETLKKALIIQQKDGEGRRIGDILAEDFSVDREAIETVVREQIERIVYSFFGWEEGAFSFELGEHEELAATSLDPLQFMLDQGLNPQWLAMEGSRILDEKRHRGEAIEEQGESTVDVDQLLADAGGEASPAGPAVEEVAAAVTAKSFLIVDDDPNTAEEITRLLTERKVRVRVFTNGVGFMEAVAEANPEETVLVIDLIMPRKDGSGLLGGLELLEDVRKNYPAFKVLVMSDHPNQEAEKSVRGFGVSTLLPKPKKNEVLEERGRKALDVLIDAFLSMAEEPADEERPDSGLFNIGAELMREMGESGSDASSGPVLQSPGLHLLRGMLQELNNPALGGGIILLILRFASELMNRAVIMLVKEKEIVGLGQFGIELPGEESPDVKVRTMKIPVDQPNLFSNALQTLAPEKLSPDDVEWNRYLFDQLGGKKPSEIFVGPLISEGRVVAVLYGDNLPEEAPIGDTEALEIFLSQAGLAMEKALLERRMSSRAAV